MTSRHTPEDLQLLGTRTAVVVGTALAVVAVFAVLVLAAEVLLLVFAGLLFGVLLSSLAEPSYGYPAWAEGWRSG